MHTKPHLLDIGSIITVCLTLILFVVSILVKGLAHALLEDAAVFLVSVKLIIGMAKVHLLQKQVASRISSIEESLKLAGKDRAA